jgi:outer membrane protein TolC
MVNKVKTGFLQNLSAYLTGVLIKLHGQIFNQCLFMYKRYLVIFIFSFIPVIVYNQHRTLDFFLNAGIQNSPLLKDYSNQINSAMVDSLLIRSSKMPQVEAKSQLLYSPAYRNFGYDEVVTDGGNYLGVVGVSQNILNRKDLNNKYKSVNIQRQIATISSRITIAELKRIITEQYLTSFAVFNELTFNRSFLELAYRESEIVRKFVSQGLCKQTDFLSLQIETQTQEILINQLTGQYEKDMRQLNQLCGINDTGLYEIVFPELQVKGSPEIDNSPLFIQYKIDSLKIQNEKEAIDVRYIMKMNWFADAGFLTRAPLNFYRHFGYSAGLGLTIPIYDGNQRDHEKQKLSIAENTRSAYKENFIIQYNQQILQLNEELKSLHLTSSQLEKQLSTAELLVNSLRSQLETGIIQMTEYINAVKNLRYINKNLSDNKIRIQLVINELNYLLSK